MIPVSLLLIWSEHGVVSYRTLWCWLINWKWSTRKLMRNHVRWHQRLAMAKPTIDCKRSWVHWRLGRRGWSSNRRCWMPRCRMGCCSPPRKNAGQHSIPSLLLILSCLFPPPFIEGTLPKLLLQLSSVWFLDVLGYQADWNWRSCGCLGCCNWVQKWIHPQQARGPPSVYSPVSGQPFWL